MEKIWDQDQDPHTRRDPKRWKKVALYFSHKLLKVKVINLNILYKKFEEKTSLPAQMLMTFN